MKTPLQYWPLSRLFYKFCLVFLNKMKARATSSLLTFGTLSPQGSCSVFYATRHQFTEVQRMMCFLLVLWYHTHTNKDTGRTRTNRLTHPCKYMLIPSVICSQQLSVLHWMNNLLIQKIFLYRLPQCRCFSEISDNEKSHICWLDSIGLRSSHETQRILRDMV